ncbi:alpha,alpha-phosphotrehalase [Alloiococcus sp. CFN-8]|uniref:alpha,alpha-phosphotrehalase n=1 Tax=Alloiococcus sp. CFN-8 TaxID=3416081 RepID=UPI003CEB805E
MKNFKHSTIYQIYPKSFYDTDGDGIGDLRGITKKLDYLSLLGVDYIWITPFYISPQRDNGYDVADYKSIDPKFGTMEDFQLLIEESDKRGIGVILDMVFNHTSTEHIWFKKALSGEERYKAYYFFQKGSENNPPTNWESKFGGNAWEYVPKLQEYYLHLFDKTQADLNWENEEVRKELYEVLEFWMSKGVKGFRFDVVNLISKPEKLENDLEGDGRSFYTDGPHVHEFLKEMNQKTYGKREGIITIGEMSSTSLSNCVKYTRQDNQELDMVFNFHHLKVDYEDGDKWTLMAFDFMKLKSIFNSWQVGMENGGGWSALFWNNHDQPRANSRFGDPVNYPFESATMLATALHLMRGTPFIYQGEEIGMTNPHYNTIDKYKDVESKNYYNILMEEGRDEKEVIEVLKAKSRDNGRTPMQWSSDKNGGFTNGEPWIAVSSNYNEVNVAKALEDKASIFYYYKKLISLRKDKAIIAEGSYTPILEDNTKVFGYIRDYKEERLIVLNNFYGQEASVVLDKSFYEGFNVKAPIIFNYPEDPELKEAMVLRPFEAVAFYLVNI